MELRQIRYFVALSEELHFGRAARRQHIVQSALSQQLQLLERELDVRLLDRSTHHVELTAAGRTFLVIARRILAQVELAATAARGSAHDVRTLRVGIMDASYDSMRLILSDVQDRFPHLEVHQVEMGVPQQYEWLIDGRLDVGFGRSALAPSDVASATFRLDRLGVLVSTEHRLAALDDIPVATLAPEPMLFMDDRRAPEFNQFVAEVCRSAGFVPTPFPGTVGGVQGAVGPVSQARCVACVPASGTPPPAGVVWKPLRDPVSSYPWSVLWLAGNKSPEVRAVIECARIRAEKLGWLETDAGPDRSGLPTP